MFEHRLDLSPLHCLWLISMPELTPAALPAVLLWDCWTARTRWRRRRGLGRTFRRRSARGCRTFLRRQRRTGRSELSSLTCRSTAGSPCGTSLIQDSASSRSFALSSMASESFPWLRNHSIGNVRRAIIDTGRTKTYRAHGTSGSTGAAQRVKCPAQLHHGDSTRSSGTAHFHRWR